MITIIIINSHNNDINRRFTIMILEVMTIPLQLYIIQSLSHKNNKLR